jgi:hypothetical protein
VAATVVVGDFAWAASVLAGFTALFVDTGVAHPLSRTLAQWGPTGGCAALLLAFAAYTTWGPRPARTVDP